MDCAIPLVTKYWEIDYGILKSIPNSGFIEKIYSDHDGVFIFYCKCGKNESFEWGLRNLTETFDYTITFCGLYQTNVVYLNKSVSLSCDELFNWSKMRYFVDQKFKIAYNFYLYEKLESSNIQKMRDFVHSFYYPSIIEDVPNAIRSPPIIYEEPVIANGSASILPAINYYSTLPKTPKKPTIPLPFQCDIVFYVDALNPSPPPNISKNDVITTKDMVKTFIFPDGTTATICRMEFFMEESIQRYQFDADALILYQTFKSIEDHQICTGCPHFNRVTECNIWQMNSHGYYLCSTCCLGLQRSKSPHNCHVPYETSKNRFRKRAAKGLCSRCSFYYRPSMKLSYIDMMMKRQPRHRIEHINYSVAEFFEILMFGNARPQFDDWNLEKQIISESPTKEIQKDTVDDSEIECVDIVTIKDTVTLSTSIEKLELTDDDKKLLSNVETEEISDFEELKEWEFAKNSSSDSSCKSIVL